jgi:hypothetical protein
MSQKYKEFNKYVEFVQEDEFNRQFEALCEAIVLSDVSFEEFWHEHALPALLESNYNNENELLVEFGLPKWMGGQGLFSQPVHPMAQKMGQNYKDQQSADMERKQAARQAKLQQYQGTVNQAIQQVKNKFVQSMRDFINVMGSEAKASNDYVSYKVAKSFYEKIMKAAQPIIDKFAMTAKYGKREDDFDRERQAMMQSKQAGMKQQLQNKFPRQGPTPPDQAPQRLAAMNKQ